MKFCNLKNMKMCESIWTSHLTVDTVGIWIGIRWLFAVNFLLSVLKSELGDAKWLLGVLWIKTNHKHKKIKE